MKKLVTILIAAAMLCSAFVFATDGDHVNARVKASFSSDFSTASNVNWEKISDHYFARFTVNQVEITAAYNDVGELVGTSRTIETGQLPISISLALAKKYEGYTFSKKAIELTFEGDTRYYLSIGNDRNILRLKCSVNGNIEVEQKIKKRQS